MSKNTTNTTNPTETPTTADKAKVVEPKPNVIVRGWQKIKSNPKTALAVVGGTALVAVASFMAGSASSTPDAKSDDEEFYGDEEETVVLEVGNN